MISDFYKAGWVMSDTPRTTQGGTVIFFTLEHEDYPDVSLGVNVCIDEMPALTMVSLLDSKGVIEKEWSDKEINIFEITEAARIVQEDSDLEEDA